MPHNIMKLFLWGSTLAGSTAVILGALGAHALKSRLVASGHVDAWRTAALYHAVHAVALVAALAIAHQANVHGDARMLKAWRRVAIAWLAGIVLFSGSLYGLSLGAPSWLGPVTPLGGIALILGWLLIAWARPSARS